MSRFYARDQSGRCRSDAIYAANVGTRPRESCVNVSMLRDLLTFRCTCKIRERVFNRLSYPKNRIYDTKSTATTISCDRRLLYCLPDLCLPKHSETRSCFFFLVESSKVRAFGKRKGRNNVVLSLSLSLFHSLSFSFSPARSLALALPVRTPASFRVLSLRARRAPSGLQLAVEWFRFPSRSSLSLDRRGAAKLAFFLSLAGMSR